MRRLTLTLLAAMALAAAPLASAGNQEVQLSETVRFADLDLQDATGIETAYRRLNQASRAVCAPLEGRDLWRTSKRQVCMSQAMNDAVARMNQPLLTQLHETRTGQPARHLAAR